MILLIYLLGYITAYILIKKWRPEDNWSDVFLTGALSLLSWLIVFIALLMYTAEKVENIKPPKWL